VGRTSAPGVRNPIAHTLERLLRGVDLPLAPSWTVYAIACPARHWLKAFAFRPATGAAGIEVGQCARSRMHTCIQRRCLSQVMIEYRLRFILKRVFMRSNVLISRRYESRLRRYESRLRRYESRLRRYESRSRRYESRLRRYESRLRRYESRSRRYESSLRRYESRSRRYESSRLRDELGRTELTQLQRHDVYVC